MLSPHSTLREQLFASVAANDREPFMPRFIREAGSVVMCSEHGPIRLTDDMCERLLDVWGEAEGVAARRLWLSLYDAHMSNGGVPR